MNKGEYVSWVFVLEHQADSRHVAPPGGHMCLTTATFFESWIKRSEILLQEEFWAVLQLKLIQIVQDLIYRLYKNLTEL